MNYLKPISEEHLNLIQAEHQKANQLSGDEKSQRIKKLIKSIKRWQWVLVSWRDTPPRKRGYLYSPKAAEDTLYLLKCKRCLLNLLKGES